jgi:hypothetical protein
MSYDLAIGVLAGVVTAFLLWVSNEFLYPYVAGMLADTPDLNKTKWGGRDKYDDPSNPATSTMEINQLGTRISAVIRRKTKEGKERVFNYRGKIRSGQIVLTWEELEGEGYNVGAMILHLSGKLNKLEGVSTYLKHDTSELVADFRTYERIS